MEDEDYSYHQYVPATLYRLCLDGICDSLRRGVWKFCSVNPFQRIPITIANDLLKFVLFNHDDDDPPHIMDIEPIITGGCLTYLNLRPLDLREGQNLLLEPIGSISDEELAWYSETNIALNILELLIEQVPHLQELHLNLQTNFNVFQNTKKLRILRFYTPPDWFHVEHFYIDVQVLSSLSNLRVLYIPEISTDDLVKVLDLCPNLISLGLVDSLDSMEEIYYRSQEESLQNFKEGSHFQLRRCFWGKNLEFVDLKKFDIKWYQSTFTYKIGFAVKYCPLVEELIIHIANKDSIELLRGLKKLKLLRIDFLECEDDYLLDFVRLIQEIGQQLKHLSIICYRPVPVDLICDYCPHLKSLEIEGPSFVMDCPKFLNISPLKRLRLSTFEEPYEEKSLVLLLSNCKNLEELFLEDVTFLDDDMLNGIFEKNSFSKLKVICIDRCTLSIEGCLLFTENSDFVEIADISSFIAEYHFDIDDFSVDPNLLYVQSLDIRTQEFFFLRLHENRF